MASFNIDFIARATGAQAAAIAGDTVLTGVCHDTRTLKPGQLFVAIKGENFDGHDFVQKALDAGAAAALVGRNFQLSGEPLLAVDDTIAALGKLARAWREELGVKLVAITGSNGKTTTKDLTAAVLAEGFKVLATRGNYNNHIGLPLTLLELTEDHQACVAEMGMNAPGEIAYLAGIARPDVGLITNVGPAHIGMLGSMEAIAAAKTELFEALGPEAVAVVNLDDPRLATWAGKLSCRVTTFGISNQANVMARDVSAFGSRQAFTMEIGQYAPMRVRLAAPGRHNVSNALGAAAVGLALGLDDEQIKRGIEEFAPPKGRLQNIFTTGGPLLIDDTYNANPASVAAGLQALTVLSKWGKGHGLIMGDMGELGPDAAALHRQVGELAVANNCKFVLALGQMAEEVAAGARDAGLSKKYAKAYGNIDGLIKDCRKILGDGLTVLIKGSRASHMELVVKRLTEIDWEKA